MTKPLELAIVGRRDSFVPMVTNNWILSGEHGNALRADRRVWTTYEHALIERYWRDPGMLWLFATNPTDTNFAYGWLCGEQTDIGPVLHYVYVRRSMRDSAHLKLGVCDTLLKTFVGHQPADRLTYTRSTPAWEHYLSRRHPRVDTGIATEYFYNPYLAFQEFAAPRS